MLKILLLAVAISCIAARKPENLDSKYRLDGEYIIALKIPLITSEKTKYAESAAEKIRGLADTIKIERTFVFNKVVFFVVHSDNEHVMSQVFEIPDVLTVEANLKQPGISQNCLSQSTGSNLWGLSRISARTPPNYSNAQYSYATNDGGSTVAYVVDSGIYVGHNDFGGRAVRGYTAQNLMNQEGEEDLNGHGTHCAGTVMSSTYGVAKFAQAIAVKIISGQGYYTGSDFLDGVNWMFQDFVRNVNAIGSAYKAVASMSLGGGGSSANDLAVQECIDAGLSVVVAAMNENKDACLYSPARMPAVITVGATDINEHLASFSNWGTCVDILGPGVNVLSTFIGSPTATQIYSGTSMATPHVAGTILRYMTQIGSRPTPAALKNWLLSQSTRDAINLRGQSSTPNLLLYAPCSMTQETVVEKQGSDEMDSHESEQDMHPGGMHYPGHHPGYPPEHHPGYGPGMNPSYYIAIMNEMRSQIKVTYCLAITAVVLLGLIFLVAFITCCHAAATTERARAAQHRWYMSNIANVINKEGV